MDIHLLHGFLGRAHDWDGLFSERAVAEDLYRFIDPFEEWADKYNASLPKEGRKVLLGYSMGGRLGLHALLQQPDLWNAAIFISTHPGLSSPAERKQRVIADEAWAKRFEKEEWEPLMQAWNSQPVFQDDGVIFDRREEHFCRHALAQSMRVWSLGSQEALGAKIAQLEIPILWMAGKEDTKFASLAESIFLKHPLSRICIMPNSGHRLPWQRPREFEAILTDFLLSLEKPNEHTK